VPEYERPLEGSFGRGVRTGVGEALSQFVALIRDPDRGRGLGRGELSQGRTLDSLQAAYRVGARVAWRRLALVGRRAKLDAEVLSLLAEAIFAYIDELSADSVEGYAAARSESEDLRRRRRAGADVPAVARARRRRRRPARRRAGERVKDSARGRSARLCRFGVGAACSPPSRPTAW
jgi:hypothetical protein